MAGWHSWMVTEIVFFFVMKRQKFYPFSLWNVRKSTGVRCYHGKNQMNTCCLMWFQVMLVKYYFDTTVISWEEQSLILCGHGRMVSVFFALINYSCKFSKRIFFRRAFFKITNQLCKKFQGINSNCSCSYQNQPIHGHQRIYAEKKKKRVEN